MIKSSKAETTESNGIIFPYHAVLVTYLFRASNCGDLFFLYLPKLHVHMCQQWYGFTYLCVYMSHMHVCMCVSREKTQLPR